MLNVSSLNAKSKEERLKNLSILSKNLPTITAQENCINNHVHTKYSFSPYSPTYAIYMAKQQGLSSVGIIDHDTFSGAEEFNQAGKILGIRTSAGIELRVDYKNTPLENKMINNPDQKGVAYMLIHGIPMSMESTVNDFLKPVRKHRFERNVLMLNKINELFSPFKIKLDIEKDIVPESYFNDGGTITERHLLLGLIKRLIKDFEQVNRINDFVANTLKISLSNKLLTAKTVDEYYIYDLLGLFKSNFIKDFYIPATKELIPIITAVDFGYQIGAFPCYSYLGDVKDCVTGDKKPQKFEDDYLDLLFKVINELGIKSITYSPTRNNGEQLNRLQNLAKKYDMFTVCGDDINSIRQSFVIKALENKEFYDLVVNSKILEINEHLGNTDLSKCYFSKEMQEKYPSTKSRNEHFLQQYNAIQQN